jgi:very-short-patch-repair endonuclease
MQRAAELRKEPSPAEAKLWAALRTLRKQGFHFRRQHAIGPYITDFCAPRYTLVIEVDGGQHLDQKEYDADRTAFLETQGYRVLRFWNGDVTNKFPEVMKVVRDESAKQSPSDDDLLDLQ